MATVLVTGGAGYIGSSLVRQLLESGHHVHVLDILRSGGESLLEVFAHPRFAFTKGDILSAGDVAGCVVGKDCVIHLAAIVGDPACAREPELARETNLAAGKRLFRACDDAGVERFIFASTCSNYGRMEDSSAFVHEDSALRPISLYAETKVAFERFLLEEANAARCAPTVLRFSTVYGLSPRIRFDLTVNQFAKELALDRELIVFGEQFWRPYCHVSDLGRSCVIALEADLTNVGSEVFNVGATDENYQKKQIVDIVREQLPAVNVEYVSKDEDPRSYRVSFDKIARRLSFKPKWTVKQGVEEVIRVIKSGLVEDPDAQRYYNIPPDQV